MDLQPGLPPLAGLAAVLIAKWPVKFMADWIGEERKFTIALAAYVIDMVVDFMVYFSLHWLANHWKPGKPAPIDRARLVHFLAIQYHTAGRGLIQTGNNI